MLTRCCLLSGVDDICLDMNWMTKCQVEWRFGDSSIVVEGQRYPLLSSEDLGQPQPREGQQGRWCRKSELQTPKVVPLMSIVFEKEFQLPYRMEPPRIRKPPTGTDLQTSAEQGPSRCQLPDRVNHKPETAIATVPEGGPSGRTGVTVPREAAVCGMEGTVARANARIGLPPLAAAPTAGMRSSFPPVKSQPRWSAQCRRSSGWSAGMWAKKGVPCGRLLQFW